MNKFFKTTSTIYESIRNKMDAASGYPSSEASSWFSPADTVPKDSEGYVYIVAIPEISEEFIKAGVLEITKEEYLSSLIQVEPDILDSKLSG